MQSHCNRRERNASFRWAVDQRTSEVVGKKQAEREREREEFLPPFIIQGVS